jgi:hypothetical protein
MGISDIRYLLASLDIKPPSYKVMQAKINSTSELITELNKDAMQNNQKLVAEVQTLRGEDNKVAAEFDCSYNNRPQAGFEAGTQAFFIMVEQNSTKKLPIDCGTVNKLCCKGSGCDHTTCSKNYGDDESIASVESKLAKTSIQDLNSKEIVQISALPTDACNQIEHVLRTTTTPIRHYKCIIHRMRSIQKNIKNQTKQTSMY